MLTLILALALQGLGESDFRELHEKLKPPAKEPWRSIPWMTSLVDAQNAAAREKKPIFIWSMDGNPLGCG
ncbi:MAG TPA: hypothetical protein VF950_17120 [Planctomycetota bacterium]